MADDALEESKQQRHAALAAEHTRKAEFHESHAGGQTASAPGGGKNMAVTGLGSFFGMLGEHKFLVIGGIAVVIVLFIALRIINGNSTSNTANQSPDLSQGGYVPANIGTALDSINNQLSSIGSTLTNPPYSTVNNPPSGTGGTKLPGPTGNPIPGGNPTTMETSRPQGSLFTNVNSGVLHYITTGSQTLSDIAHEFGLDSWNSIYAIPENQKMLGKMSASTLRHFSPGAGINLVLPKSVTPNSSWFEVTDANSNNLSTIAALENVSLQRIEQLNPQLPADVGLLPGTEVKFA